MKYGKSRKKLILLTLFITVLLVSNIAFEQTLNAQDEPYLLKDIKIGDEVNAVTWFPDGEKLLVGLNDGTAKIIDIESEKAELSFKEHWKGIMDVCVDPAGKFFVTAGDNTIKVWDLEGNEISRMPDHTTTIYSIDIDPAGKHLVSGAINKVFKYWEIKTGKLLYDMKGHSDVAMAVAFSNNGKLIASGSGDHTIKIWKAGTDSVIMTLKGHSKDIYAVTFSHNDRYLASCSQDRTVRIYDLEKRELSKILSGHRNFVMDIEFTPDDLHLLSCSFDKEIRLWEIPSGKTLYTFINHDAEITDLSFTPDGKSFSSASHDKTVKIWKYSPEIFVDYYYRDEVVEDMSKNDIFLPRKKGESRSEFEERMSKAEKIKEQIYREYYTRYISELEKGILPGLN